MPAPYNHSFFVAEHGSYNPASRRYADGHKIENIYLENGTWKVREFVRGFLTDSITYTRWARPCGIIADTEGNIYFTSDHGAPDAPKTAIFRIHYTGTKTVHDSKTIANALMVETMNNGTLRISVDNVAGKDGIIECYSELGTKLDYKILNTRTSETRRIFDLEFPNYRGPVFIKYNLNEKQSQIAKGMIAN